MAGDELFGLASRGSGEVPAYGGFSRERASGFERVRVLRRERPGDERSRHNSHVGRAFHRKPASLTQDAVGVPVSFFVGGEQIVLNGMDFEVWCMHLLGTLFARKGHRIMLLSVSDGHGSDVLLPEDGILVRCVLRAGQVSADVVRAASESAQSFDMWSGVVMTNSIFDKKAVDEAFVSDVLLLDGASLVGMLGEVRATNGKPLGLHALPYMTDHAVRAH